MDIYFFVIIHQLFRSIFSDNVDFKSYLKTFLKNSFFLESKDLLCYYLIIRKNRISGGTHEYNRRKKDKHPEGVSTGI